MKRTPSNMGKRFRSVALYAAGAVSLLMLLATLLTWMWLGRYEKSVAYVRPNSQVQVGAFADAIIIDRSVVTWSPHPRWEVRDANFFITVDRDEVGRETGKQIELYELGDASVRTITRTFRNKTGGPAHQQIELGMWIPYWLVLLPTLPIPLWIMTVHRRRQVRASRRAAGRCEQCGYDLRATPGRCPECGADATMPLPARL